MLGIPRGTRVDQGHRCNGLTRTRTTRENLSFFDSLSLSLCVLLILFPSPTSRRRFPCLLHIRRPPRWADKTGPGPFVSLPVSKGIIETWKERKKKPENNFEIRCSSPAERLQITRFHRDLIVRWLLYGKTRRRLTT